MKKKKRKCKNIPNKWVGYNECETCAKNGGRCSARDKYDRNKEKHSWEDKEDLTI